MRIFFLLALPAVAFGVGGEQLIGGPTKVDVLSPEQEAIVEVAKVHLAGNTGELLGEGDSCPFKQFGVHVENFSQQVVAGLLYKFDLVLNAPDTGCKTGAERRCTVKVIEQVWLNRTEVIDADCPSPEDTA